MCDSSEVDKSTILCIIWILHLNKDSAKNSVTEENNRGIIPR